MWNKIVNPKTGRKVNINSKIGKSVLRNYMKQLGGAEAGLDPKEDEYTSNAVAGLDPVEDGYTLLDIRLFGMKDHEFLETYQTEYLEKLIHIFPEDSSRSDATTIVETINDPQSVLVRNSSTGTYVCTFIKDGKVRHNDPRGLPNYNYGEGGFLQTLFFHLRKKFKYVISPNTAEATYVKEKIMNDYGSAPIKIVYS